MFLILYKIVYHIHGVTPKGICMQRPRKKGPKIIISIALSGWAKKWGGQITSHNGVKVI